MIKAVLFDLGGTLHQCSGSPERDLWFASRLIHRLADYGVSLETTPEAFSARLKTNAETYKADVEQSMRELPSEIIWNDYYLKEYEIGRERLKPFAEELSFLYDYERVKNMRRKDLTQTMDELQAMGLRIGVISNIISLSIVDHFLAEYGLTRYMQCVITSAGTGIRKPSAEIFRVAEAALNLPPEQLAYVGDTISRDVRGARNAGWRLMIQIRNPGTAHRDACMRGLGYKPDYLIDELREIPDILRKENLDAQRGKGGDTP